MKVFLNQQAGGHFYEFRKLILLTENIICFSSESDSDAIYDSPRRRSAPAEEIEPIYDTPRPPRPVPTSKENITLLSLLNIHVVSCEKLINLLKIYNEFDYNYLG